VAQDVGPEFKPWYSKKKKKKKEPTIYLPSWLGSGELPFIPSSKFMVLFFAALFCFLGSDG
jgi:hypothetical protein